MAGNTKLSVAIHTAAMLAVNKDRYVTSDEIASSVDTNPVVIRRILCKLHEAGIVECCTGKRGGAKLRKKPDKISLLDLYRAVEDEPLFAQHGENEECGLSCSMKLFVGRVFEHTQKAVSRNLKKTTLAEVVKTIG